MTEQHITPYLTKCEILGDFWMGYRGNPDFDDFIEYNDLGLPLAYALSEKIVESTPLAENYISETFDLLLASLEIEDTGFDSLDELFDSATK